MKKLFTLLLAFAAIGRLSAQLSATTSFTNTGCSGNAGSATVTPSGGTNYTYKWSNGASTQTISSLVAGTYTVTVYSGSGGSTTYDTLWYETFDEASPAWTVNISFGTNQADNNYWLIGSTCTGNLPVGSCGTNNGGNNCLYVTSVSQFFTGATYDAGGGLPYNTMTHMGAQSDSISTMGAHNLILAYQYMGDGQTTNDFGQLNYSTNSGTSFTTLVNPVRAATTGCNREKGKWAYNAVNLPAACNNLTGFELQMQWTNNNDGAGSDPSCAIDNIAIIDSIPGGGTTDSIVETVTISATPTPHIVGNSLVVTNPTCGQTNGSITGMNEGGGTTPYSVVWKNSSNQTVSTSNSLTNVGAGTYTFTVTDSNGCTADTVITLVSPNGPTLVTTNLVVTQPGCGVDNGSITGLTVTGGAVPYVEIWDSNGVSIANTLDINNLGGGTFLLTVTDNNGCEVDTTINLTATGAPVLITSGLQITQPGCGAANGSITGISESGGAGNYTEQWKNSSNQVIGNSNAITGLAAGTYTFIVRDGNGCTVDTLITLTSASAPLLVTSGLQITEPSCGQANGSINGISESGGSGSYTEQWKNSSNQVIGNSNSISGIGAGTYTLLVTDANGCTVDTSIALVAPGSPALLSAGLTIVSPSCGLDNGSITGLNAGGGATPYTEAWDSNGVVVGSSFSLSNIGPGTFVLTVTDANGCSIDTSITITGTGAATIPSISADKDTICASDSATICVTPNNYSSYSWNGGQTTPCIIVNLAGNYYVSVTDNNNCTANSNHLALTVLTPPSSSIAVEGDTLTAFGEVGYQWFRNGTLIPGATSASYVATESGNYTVQVTDSNGCSSLSNPVTVSGIHNLLPAVNFEIYPNPSADGSLQLLVATPLINKNFSIYDAEGRLITTSKISSEKTEIDVSNYAKGVYLFKLEGTIKKFIKE